MGEGCSTIWALPAPWCRLTLGAALRPGVPAVGLLLRLVQAVLVQELAEHSPVVVYDSHASAPRGDNTGPGSALDARAQYTPGVFAGWASAWG